MAFICIGFQGLFSLKFCSIVSIRRYACDISGKYLPGEKIEMADMLLADARKMIEIEVESFGEERE